MVISNNLRKALSWFTCNSGDLTDKEIIESLNSNLEGLIIWEPFAYWEKEKVLKEIYKLEKLIND